jgi:hypothetical protein
MIALRATAAAPRAPGRGEERVDRDPLHRQAGGRHRGVLHPPASPAGQLPGGRGRAADDPGDVLERHREHVVQDEREPLGRCQRPQHHQHREPDLVREYGLLLGIVGGDQFHVEGFVPPGPQHVQADPRRDRGQPPAEVLDLRAGRPGQPQPGLLHRVLGLGTRPEHPVRHREQPGPVLLENFRGDFHVTFLRRVGSYP